MGTRKPIQKLLSYAVMLPTILLSSPHSIAEQGDSTSKTISSSTVQYGRQQLNSRYEKYILGPGDLLRIEWLDLPELSGNFRIGPDGTLYLPRIRALQAEGHTIEELSSLLNKRFRQYIRQPEIFISLQLYRPVRVYVGGEVARPGYYTIQGAGAVQDLTYVRNNNKIPCKTHN